MYFFISLRIIYRVRDNLMPRSQLVNSDLNHELKRTAAMMKGTMQQNVPQLIEY